LRLIDGEMRDAAICSRLARIEACLQELLKSR
jgi:hypothetical protein